MKISLITIIDNVNFGTYLQAYASVKVLEDRGYDVEIIDYHRPNSSLKRQVYDILHNAKRNVILRCVYAVACLVFVPIIKHKLRCFLTKRFIFSKKRYNSFQSLKLSPPKADLYLTGSDQVWNSNYNDGVDRSFFLDFTSGKKASYASSIGLDFLPENEEHEVKQLLSEYSSLSVREAGAIDALKNIGINANISHVLDPTLLLDKCQWREIAAKDKFEKTEPYLLIYSVEISRGSIISKQAREIAKARNLKIYLVTSSDTIKLKNCGADKLFGFASIERFLNLFLQADFTIVSSFHGTAFSINMGKEFLTISPDKFNVRINSLLSLFNLQDRLITDSCLQNENIENIDFIEIDKILDRERKKSIQYLEQLSL